MCLRNRNITRPENSEQEKMIEDDIRELYDGHIIETLVGY